MGTHSFEQEAVELSLNVIQIDIDLDPYMTWVSCWWLISSPLVCLHYCGWHWWLHCSEIDVHCLLLFCTILFNIYPGYDIHKTCLSIFLETMLLQNWKIILRILRFVVLRFKAFFVCTLYHACCVNICHSSFQNRHFDVWLDHQFSVLSPSACRTSSERSRAIVQDLDAINNICSQVVFSFWHGAFRKFTVFI